MPPQQHTLHLGPLHAMIAKSYYSMLVHVSLARSSRSASTKSTWQDPNQHGKLSENMLAFLQADSSDHEGLPLAFIKRQQAF